MAVREDRMTWLGSMVRVMVQVQTDARKDSTKQLFVSHYIYYESYGSSDSEDHCCLLDIKLSYKKKHFASGVPADAVPEAGAGQLHLLHGEPGLRSRPNSCQGELQVFPH